jgi:hypothetical protein
MEFLVPALILTASCCLLIVFRRRIRRDVWFALALISIPLLPVLDLKQLNEEYMVWDRYLYLPAMGFCYLLALGILALPGLLKPKHDLRSLSWRHCRRPETMKTPVRAAIRGRPGPVVHEIDFSEEALPGAAVSAARKQ